MAERNANDHEAVIDAIFAFTTRVLQIVAPHVPCVKFQSAYFEQYQWDGVESYYSLIGEASEMGLLVIGDVKRGDIGSTASAYAAGHLADPPTGRSPLEDLFMPDAITVNPILRARHARALREDRAGLRQRTVRAGSDEQSRLGRTAGRAAGGRAEPGRRCWPIDLGDHGAGKCRSKWLQLGGAVVGATQPQTMVSLRERLPQSIFLLPGYGAQGATGGYDPGGVHRRSRGAGLGEPEYSLRSSRPEYADRFGGDWEKCVEAAVIDMKADIARVIQ